MRHWRLPGSSRWWLSDNNSIPKSTTLLICSQSNPRRTVWASPNTPEVIKLVTVSCARRVFASAGAQQTVRPPNETSKRGNQIEVQNQETNEEKLKWQR